MFIPAHVLPGRDAFSLQVPIVFELSARISELWHSLAPGRFLSVSVDLGDVHQEVENTTGVAPLVVVPRNELDKVLVQGDTGLGVKDGGAVVTAHVRRDDLVLGVAEYACKALEAH